MEKIHRGDGFAIIEKDGEYQISWAQGPYNQPVFYPISKQNMKKAFQSDQDAYEVMIYAQTGQWPTGVKEENEINIDFLQKYPELLLKVPENQELLTKPGLQSKGYESIKNEIKNALKKHFDDRIGSFSVFSQTDIPYTMFSLQFTAYNYFNVILNYDRGSFGCSIVTGDAGIGLKNSQKWYDEADLDVFCKELREQLELRIPDKFLEYHGWK
ncbi:hypothetical protein [Bacillus sp. P14.5]|uniref:hypothetical protein n=1 Tax=Bacillus sp. P14.5 TaxID=1983400 RepID=UPI001F05F48B|nr:hypothetical protein [Bacillus sp. P14.5]